jgi:hypothetical protein
MPRPAKVTPLHLTSVRSDSPPAVASSRATIAAGPLRELERRWVAQLAVIAKWNEGAVPAAVARALAELREALAQAERQESRLSLKDAARQYGMAISTLTWICRHHKDAVDALKVRREWTVDRASFERYLATCRGGAA